MMTFLTLKEFLPYSSLEITGVAVGFIAFISLVILINKPQSGFAKAFFFLLLTALIVGATAFITGETFYKISISPTKGPVHWHADFRIFKCGSEIDLVDPTGLSNRVGDPLVHEHGDLRIHIEGIITSLDRVSLGNFFDTIGGELTNTKLSVPTNEGVVSMENGELCSDGTPGVLQVFLWETFRWRTDDAVAQQRKISDFSSYVMHPEELIPPGDCVIFEFGPEKARTNYICDQYEVAGLRGDIVIER